MPRRFRLRMVLLIGVGMIAVLEVGLRVLTDRSSLWNVRLGAHKQFDPVVFFRNKPNYDLGRGLVTNEYGYRAPRNLTPEIPPGVLRILYLGDSNTVTPLYDNYPSQVEPMLERELGVEVQTVNTAVPGYSSENARLLLETEVSQFDADYFFVYLGWNDLGQFGPDGLPYKRHDAGYELSPLQRVLTNVYSLRLLYAGQQILKRRQPAVDAPMSEEDRARYLGYWPDHFYTNMRAILDLATSRYPRVYVMTLATITNEDPTPEELSTAHFPTGMDKNMRKLHHLVQVYNGVVRQVADEVGVPIIDLYDLFDSREARRDFTDSCHMNGTGAGRIAEALVDVIVRNERNGMAPPLGASASQPARQ